jgi:hypothetical protein
MNRDDNLVREQILNSIIIKFSMSMKLVRLNKICSNKAHGGVRTRSRFQVNFLFIRV